MYINKTSSNKKGSFLSFIEISFRRKQGGRKYSLIKFINKNFSRQLDELLMHSM